MNHLGDATTSGWGARRFLPEKYGVSGRQLYALVGDPISWRRFCRIPWGKTVPHPSSLTKIRQPPDADGSDHMALLNEHLAPKLRRMGR
ncbi:MAG TPA: transposase [Firmicutes bacterium]|nr:transposase [Bacillota bacterium]